MQFIFGSSLIHCILKGKVRLLMVVLSYDSCKGEAQPRIASFLLVM
jgi:hypothetical protein